MDVSKDFERVLDDKLCEVGRGYWDRVRGSILEAHEEDRASLVLKLSNTEWELKEQLRGMSEFVHENLPDELIGSRDGPAVLSYAKRLIKERDALRVELVIRLKQIDELVGKLLNDLI